MNRNCNAGYTNWNCNRTRRLHRGTQITLPPWRRNRTIYTMYTSLTGQNCPFSTVPLSPRVGEIGIVRQRSWEMDNWSGCVHPHSYCSGVDICTYQRASGTARHSMNGKKEGPGWCHGRRQEVELMPWKKTTEVAGVRPWLETLSESCIGLSSSLTSHWGQRQLHPFWTPGHTLLRLN